MVSLWAGFGSPLPMVTSNHCPKLGAIINGTLGQNEAPNSAGETEKACPIFIYKVQVFRENKKSCKMQHAWPCSQWHTVLTQSSGLHAEMPGAAGRDPCGSSPWLLEEGTEEGGPHQECLKLCVTSVHPPLHLSGERTALAIVP